MSTCRCGTTTRDNHYVCDNCLGDLARMLGEVPWVVEQLEITLTKARGVDYTALGGAPSSTKPLPVDPRALDASAALRSALVTWVRFCDEESIRHQSPKSGLPVDDLLAMSRWLLWRVDGLALNDLGGDAVSELTRAIGRCVMVIDRPAERKYAGPCECGRDLYAKPAAKTTKCQSCEREYDVEALVQWMRDGVMDRLVTAFEGSTLLGRFDLPTAQGTIDKWHERKRVIDHGRNPEGRFVYLMSDLIGLAAHGGRKSA